MKFKSFIVAGSGEVAAGIREIAGALFNLTELELSCEGRGLDHCLPLDAVYICTHIYSDEQTVETAIYFWQESFVKRLVRRTSDPDMQSGSEEATFLRLTKLNVLKLLSSVTGINPSPWGILRGIRPTKIVHRLLDKGLDDRVIVNRLKSQFGIDVDKAELVTAIALRQRKFLPVPSDSPPSVSIYVGIPYCPTRCLYCSFPGYPLPACIDRIEAFLTALAIDLKAATEIIKANKLRIQTIYVGGGTPTSLAANHFAQLMELISSNFLHDSTVEFTVEAGRPDSIDDDKISIMRGSGVTRVSINPQTMQQKTLNLIGRRHTVQDIIDVFGKFRALNFPVINMDIIAGLPGETAADMADTMNRIAALKPDNITVHTLAVKKGSLLKMHASTADIPDEKTVKSMLKIAYDCARHLGMAPYYLYRQKYMAGNFENVGYAGWGQECLYNIQIMEERQTILGIGPGAGTKAVSTTGWRLDSFYNPKDIDSYITHVKENAQKRQNILDRVFAETVRRKK